MKIQFLSGSLERGKGGVADYTVLLAEECQRQGHSCQLLALNDPFVDQPESGTIGATPFLRLPRSMSWEERTPLAVTFLQSFSPDWVSIQFVCYSFQQRGILWKQAAYFKRIIAGHNVQIMFHEAWIGVLESNSFKERIIGLVQRKFIRNFIETISPKVCHTHTPGYKLLYQQLGVEPEILPLFGNIPLNEEENTVNLFQEIEDAGYPIDRSEESSYLIAITFGGLLTSRWKPDALLQKLEEFGKRKNRKPLILVLGNHGDGLQNPPWSTTIAQYESRIPFVVLGEQSSRRLSHFFDSADIGISATPSVTIEKSGAAAAMSAHGLPILLARSNLRFRGLGEEQFVSHPHMYRLEDLDRVPIDLLLKRSERTSRLPSVAKQFLASLAKAE